MGRLLDRTDCLLLVIDAQPAFYGDAPDAGPPELRLALERAAWLAGVAAALDVPTVVTEEDAERNGGTARTIVEALPAATPFLAKRVFGAADQPDILAAIEVTGRRSAVLVSAAPVPGSTEPLRRFEAAFRERFGREPGPYAAIGYEAMRSVLEAISAAGDRGGSRQRVIDTYFGAGERRGTVLGDYTVGARGQLMPARFTAFRVRGGGAEYLLR